MIIKKKKPLILICLLITYFVVQATEKRADNAISTLYLSTAERALFTNNYDLPKEKEEEEDWSTIRYYFFVRSAPVPTLPDQQLSVLARYGE